MEIKVGAIYKDPEDLDVIQIVEKFIDPVDKEPVCIFKVLEDPNGFWELCLKHDRGDTKTRVQEFIELNYIPCPAYNTPLYHTLNVPSAKASVTARGSESPQIPSKLKN